MPLIIIPLLMLTATVLSSHHRSGSFAVRDVRVFDGERIIRRTNVLVRDGRIQTIAADSTALDAASSITEGEGRTLLPGLIDSHVHVGYDVTSALEQAIVMGVTTVLDLGSQGERLKTLKRVAAEDAPGLADLRTAGSVATAPGGHPTQMGGPPFPTLASAAEAGAFVDVRIAEGSDYIKIVYDDLSGIREPVPMLSRSTLDALIAAAHRRGKLAVVHVLSEEQAREASEAGADVLAHLFMGPTSSPTFGNLASKHRVAVTPTLSVICGDSQAQSLLTDRHLSPFIRPGWGRMLEMPREGSRSCGGAQAAIKRLVKARVPILAGSDAPSPGTAYGVSLHGELSLLVRSGLSPVQALMAATSAAARTFRLTDRGSIRPGMRADLVLVDGDPTQDILATRRIVSVWKRGFLVNRDTARKLKPDGSRQQ
jgi:imidazolonepropionase-like amidohydrolase